VQHYIYLAEHASIETADRFLANAEESFSELAESPAMGVALNTRHEDLKGTRKWQVKGFEKFLIFYQPRQNGVTIIRVLHGAQDWWTLLGIEIE
jgi:toxin ParE1/3/4